MPDFSALSSAASWPFSLQNYIESRGSFELALAFSELFWPRFVEHRDCIIRADGFTEENFGAWHERLAGDSVAIERVLNLIHVRDLVPSDTTELSSAAYLHLAELLVEMWTARVRILFPNRSFVIRLESSGDDDWTAPTVLLYQDR